MNNFILKTMNVEALKERRDKLAKAVEDGEKMIAIYKQNIKMIDEHLAGTEEVSVSEVNEFLNSLKV